MNPACCCAPPSDRRAGRRLKSAGRIPPPEPALWIPCPSRARAVTRPSDHGRRAEKRAAHARYRIDARLARPLRMEAGAFPPAHPHSEGAPHRRRRAVRGKGSLARTCRAANRPAAQPPARATTRWRPRRQRPQHARIDRRRAAGAGAGRGPSASVGPPRDPAGELSRPIRSTRRLRRYQPGGSRITPALRTAALPSRTARSARHAPPRRRGHRWRGGW